MAVRTDSDLLLGLLALQNGLVEQADLIAAFQTWSKGRARPLGRVLIERGAMTEDDGAMLEGLVRRHLEKHGGDAERSLAAVAASRTAREVLERVEDADVQATLTRLSGSGTQPDPEVTASWGLGTPEADGARFRRLRPHARGGIGVVSVAMDVDLHREVALKEIRPEQADDPTSRARFLLEAELTGRLEHPGVVPVYALGADAKGRPYYAMRFVKGDSLKEAIERFHRADAEPGRDPGERSLELRKLLTRFVSVCDAVAYAHSRGVIHRDIKPSNILLGPYGETLVVDWGLAKVVGRDEPEAAGAEETLQPATASGSSETQAGTAIGTPAYMSPEQAEGRLEAMGVASDVYSLGGTLFCLLTGRPPIDDRDVAEVLRKVRKGEIPRAREVNPRVPAALEAVCARAMAADPRGRYVSARALADEVEHWLADEPVSAYREPWPDRARRLLRRHRSLVGILAVGVSVVIAALVSIAAHQGLMNIQLEQNNHTLAQAIAESGRALLKAQRREDLAFQALDKYQQVIFEIQELRDRPDLLPIRRRLLEAPMEFYRQLKQETEGSDRAGRATDQATASRIALAEIGLAAIGAELGSEADAMAAYEQAIVGLESLVRESGLAEYRRDLAWALNNLGYLQVNAGRFVEARAAFQRSLMLRQALALEAGSGSVGASHLAQSFANLGWLESKTGQPALALGNYQMARQLLEALAREAPDDEWRQESLAQTCSNLGWMLAQLRRRDEAREWLTKAREIQEALVARQPSYVSRRLDLATTCSHLGELEQGDAAFAPMRRAVELREAVARAAPSVPSNQSLLATALMWLGNIHRSAGRFDEALAAQGRAVEVLEPVVLEHPATSLYRINLASALNHRGLTLADASRPAEALPDYTKALDLLSPLLERDPSNAEARSLVAGTHNNRGLALAKLGRHEEALTDYRDAIREERICFEAAPQMYQYRSWLALHTKNMLKSLLRLGRLDEADAAYRDWRSLWDGAPPEHLGPEVDYDSACYLALLASTVGGGRPVADLTEAERDRRRGYVEAAFADLRAAVEGGFDRTTLFADDPDLDAIRSDPRFAPLLLRMLDRTFPADPFAHAP